MILGREPAAIVALVKAALYFAAGFWVVLDDVLVALILAALTAVLDLIVAAKTDQTTFGVIMAVFNTGLVLVVHLGLDWTDHQQAGFLALAAAVIGFFVQRTQVSPIAKATFSNEQPLAA